MRLRELMRIRELYEINDIRFTIYENYMRILRIIYDLRITIHENVVIKIDSFRKFFAENKKAQKKHAYKHADKYTSKKIKIKQTAFNRASRLGCSLNWVVPKKPDSSLSTELGWIGRGHSTIGTKNSVPTRDPTDSQPRSQVRDRLAEFG